MSNSEPTADATLLPRELQGLLRPEAYPHPVLPVRVIGTHMSWVLLTGDFAYKIKRPVRFAFADFSDPQHRERLCEEEIRLNRRFAPSLYLGVWPIRQSHDQATFMGDGPKIGSAVRMRQFDRESELDVLVEAAAVTADEFETFGTTLATAHAGLPQPGDNLPYGHARDVARVIRRNYAECLAQPADVGTTRVLRTLRVPLARLLRRRRPVLAARVADGRVRECHGDLHLSNIVRIEGRLIPFDALEFEPAFRWIDVADEVAFLWADLAGYGHPDLAAAFLGGYLDRSGDFDLLRVLDLYVTHRGLVRAKIMAIRAAGATDEVQRDRWRTRQADYVEVARRALSPRVPRLLLMHGLSGSGKTWLARQLARRLGAVHLRSDVERKRLAGLAPLAVSGSPPGSGLYVAELSERTYAHLEEAARAALAGGQTVVCDATFLARERRADFRRLAAEAAAPAFVIDCTAPDDELRRRLKVRERLGRDVSEADGNVLRWQRERQHPLGPDEALVIIRVDTTGADPLADALGQLAMARPPSGS